MGREWIFPRTTQFAWNQLISLSRQNQSGSNTKWTGGWAADHVKTSRWICKQNYFNNHCCILIALNFMFFNILNKRNLWCIYLSKTTLLVVNDFFCILFCKEQFSDVEIDKSFSFNQNLNNPVLPFPSRPEDLCRITPYKELLTEARLLSYKASWDIFCHDCDGEGPLVRSLKEIISVWFVKCQVFENLAKST